MDRDLLEQRLNQAEQAVRLGFALIAEQRAIVLALEARGQDASTARRQLESFETMQEFHLDEFETARVQLAADDQRKVA